MFRSVIQLPWIHRGQLCARLGQRNAALEKGRAGSADKLLRAGKQPEAPPSPCGTRAIHPRGGCQVTGRCGPLFWETSLKPDVGPQALPPSLCGHSGPPFPHRGVRSGLQEEVLRTALAGGSMVLPQPEGSMWEAWVPGCAQGQPTCSLLWVALAVSHCPGPPADPGPAMPPLGG